MKFGPLWFLPGKNSGKYPYCHSVHVEADLSVLIDPASDRQRLLEVRKGARVDAVWLSHAHEDHFTHLDLFDDKELWIPEPEAGSLRSLDRFLDAYGMNAEERSYWAELMVEQFNFKPRRPHRLFRGEEVIDLGGVTVEVLPTPGHTPGHCSFFFREPEVLFLGDYDLTPFGPWYGDVHSDIEATIASVNRLRSIPAKIWIASHEKGVFRSEPADLWDLYLKTIHDREQKLLDLLKKPRSMSEIVDARILYGRKREPKEFYDFGERSHMGKHLQRLIGQGRVICKEGVYHRT